MIDLMTLWIGFALVSFGVVAYLIFSKDLDGVQFTCIMGVWALVFGFSGFFLSTPLTQTDVFRISEKADVGDSLYLIGEGDRWYKINDPWAFYKIQPGQDVQVDAVYEKECVGRWSCNEKPPEITRVYWFGGSSG